MWARERVTKSVERVTPIVMWVTRTRRFNKGHTPTRLWEVTKSYIVVGQWRDEMQIAKYIIITNDGGDKLTDRVNVLIEDGWQPYGSPFSGVDAIAVAATECDVYVERDRDHKIYQAMVKYDVFDTQPQE